MNPPKVVQDSIIIQRSFSGGINTSVPPELLSEDELVDSLNFEFNEDDHLTTRAGVNEWGDISYPNRITSLHYYSNDDGDQWIFSTSGAKLYASDPSGITADITDTLVLPNNTFWQWVNFAGLAIGANGAKTGDNPIKVYGPTPTVGVLGGSPPPIKFPVLWNERIWAVDADNPNTVVSSKLGDPEDWTDTGADGAAQIDIGKNDGDQITGLYVFDRKLFVFKRRKIYFIGALEGTNSYDLNNLFADVYSSGLGCVSGYSIKEIINDVLFLSEYGIASLVQAPLGILKSTIVSRKVKELETYKKTSPEISSYVCEKANQYWLMMPSTASTRGIYEIYVLDYARLGEGKLRWFRFDGKIAGTWATNILISGENFTLIASQDNRIYSYRPQVYDYAGLWDVASWDVSEWDVTVLNKFRDVESLYTKLFQTRTIDFGLSLIRKKYHRFGFLVSLLSNDLKLKLRYFFDKILSYGDEYFFTYEIETTAAYWDISEWDEGRWDEETKLDFIVYRQFKRNERGRKAISCTFIVSNDLNQGFTFRDLSLEIVPLNRRQANDVGRIQ
jgi:hypothetical protein